MLEALKISEDQEAITFRLYELHNKRGTARLRSWTKTENVIGTDLLESKEGSRELAASGDEIAIPYKNYQILTLKAKISES